MDGRATRDVAISITAAPRSAIAIDDVARWAALYEDLRPALVRALAAVFGSYDGVDDAIQDAFAAAMRGSPDDLRSPGGWLYAVASNKLRSRRRRLAVAARLRLRPSTQPDRLDDALRRADVVRVLRELPPRDRELLVAKHYLGFTQEEIAAHLKVPRGTVASALSRAAARFRAVDGEP